MTQPQIDREVARRTGESLQTVRQVGFSLDRPHLGRRLRLQSRRKRLQQAEAARR